MGCVSCLHPACGQKPWGEERILYWESWNKDSSDVVGDFCMYMYVVCMFTSVNPHMREHTCMCVSVWNPEVIIRMTMSGFSLSHLVRSLSETQGSPTSRVLDNLLWWSPFSAFQTLELQEGCHAHQAFRWVLGTAKSSLTELSDQLWLLWFLAHLH